MEEASSTEQNKEHEPIFPSTINEADTEQVESISHPIPTVLHTETLTVDDSSIQRERSTSFISQEEETVAPVKESSPKEDFSSNLESTTPGQSDSPASTDSIPRAPSNPKSHPALPRPPLQNTQRPIFHIIAPRGTNPSGNDPKIIIPRAPSVNRMRHPVTKSVEATRPTRIRTSFEPRPRPPFMRMEKPAVTVPRPRKPATAPVVNILQSPSSSKIPVKPAAKIHHIPPSTKTNTKPTAVSTSLQQATPGPSMSTSIPIVRMPPKSVNQTNLSKKTKASISEDILKKRIISQVPVRAESMQSASVLQETRSEPGQSTSAILVSELPQLSTSLYQLPSVVQPPERQNREKDAIDYLEKVKKRFDSDTYTTFLDVMKGFRQQDMDTIGVIRRVCFLFSSEPSLIDEFNGFLPQGYDITIEGSKITIKDRDGRLHNVDTTIDPNRTKSKLSTTPAIQSTEELAPRTFDNAVVFLQALKSRVSRKNYERFLEIIKSCEGRSHLDPESGKRMFQDVAEVLENDEDLLLGFSSFLPEMQQWCVLEFQKKQRYEAGLTNKDYYWKVENAMRRLSKVNDENAPENSLIKYKPFTSKPIRNLFQVLKVSNVDDFAFFNKVREAIDNDRIFDNLCRVLRLYTNGLIDRHELFTTCMPFFKGLPLLQCEFKKILGFKDSVVYNPNTELVSKSTHVNADMRAELDFTTLRRNGRSYRLLPEEYRHPKCSGRTRLCQEVLNDEWAIFPSWQSEETTRVSVKKSQFEEFLHRTEDERFEIDILLQINSEAMAALERIRRLASKNPRYEVDSKYECNSKTLMARAVRRAYGENTEKVFEAMKRNPYMVATTVLNRLKLKHREWKNMENAFKLVWEDQAKKHYQKMNTKKVTNSRNNDNKLLSGGLALNILHRLYKKREFDSVKYGVEINNERTKIIVPLRFDWKALYDINDIMLGFIKKQAGIPEEIKKQMKRFIKKVLPMVFNYVRKPQENDPGVSQNKFICPRIYHCGDNFIHFIHLFHIVASRLSKLINKSRNRAKEEAFKFNMLKLRQEIFDMADKRLPSWASDQWDIIEGFDAIIPEKERSLDRYYQYMLNLQGLLEGKVILSAYEQLTERLFDEDCYIALGLDKFLVTMVKILRSIVDDKHQMRLVNELWNANYVSEMSSQHFNYNNIVQQVKKIYGRENLYEIEIFDEKETNNSFMTMRMIYYTDPYNDKIDKFGVKEWQMFRRTYRQSLNIVRRNKRMRCRFKSKPLFLIRNLKAGWERMGRYDALKEYDFDSADEGSDKEKTDNSLSSVVSESDESEIEITKDGMPNEWPYGKHDHESHSEDRQTSSEESDTEEKSVTEKDESPDVRRDDRNRTRSASFDKEQSDIEMDNEESKVQDQLISEDDTERKEEDDSNSSSEESKSGVEANKRSGSTSTNSHESVIKKKKRKARSPSPIAGPSVSRSYQRVFDATIISEDECRRRINKFTNIQDYKLLKSEFRSVRIEPVSETEHDYEDETIVNYGASHMSGSMEDRIWWSTALRIKRDSSSSSEDSDNSSKETRRKYKKKKQRKKPSITKERQSSSRRGSSSVRIDVKSKKPTPSSESSISREDIQPSDALNEILKNENELDTDTDIERRIGPAPPKRYSSDEDESPEETVKNKDLIIEEIYPNEEFKQQVDEILSSKRNKQEDKGLRKKPPNNESDDDIETARSGEQVEDLEIEEPERIEMFEDNIPTTSQTVKSRSRSHSQINQGRKKTDAHKKLENTKKESDKTSSDKGTEILRDELETKRNSERKSSTSSASSSSSTSTTSSLNSEPLNKRSKMEVPESTDTNFDMVGGKITNKQTSASEEDTDEETMKQQKDHVINIDKTKNKKIQKKNHVVWISKELADACKADLCNQMICLDNKTAPNVMYRLGSSTDAKNSNVYRNLKLTRFRRWINAVNKTPDSTENF